MASVDPLLLIENDTPADATPVRTNFDLLENFVNTQVVHTDGTINMTGPLTLPSAGTADNHAATVGQIASSPAAVPTGSILDFAGASAPAGYVMCDGRAYSPTDAVYQALFAVIGTTYGESDGNFKVPDFTGNRVSAAASSGDFARGKTGGHRSSVAQHSHPVPEHGHGHDFGVSNKVKFNTEKAKDDHTHKWSDTIKDNVTRRSSQAPVGDTSSALKVVVSNNNQGFENGRMSSNSTVWTPMPATPSGQGNHIPALSTGLSIDWGETLLMGSTTTVAGAGGQAGFGHAHEVPEHGHSLTGGVKNKPGFNTNSTGDVGDTNYPPYVAVNKIIRL